MNEQTATIGLLTAGAPTFPDEGYALIPVAFPLTAPVDLVLRGIQEDLAEPLGFLQMLMADSPGGCIRGWVISANLGLRLICEAALHAEGVQIVRG